MVSYLVQSVSAGADPQIGMDHPDSFAKIDFGLAVLRWPFRDNLKQSPRLLAALDADRHRDPYRRRVRSIDPGMVRDRESQRNPVNSFELRLNDPTVERLRQAVGRDKAEAAHAPGRTIGCPEETWLTSRACAVLW